MSVQTFTDSSSCCGSVLMLLSDNWNIIRAHVPHQSSTIAYHLHAFTSRDLLTASPATFLHIQVASACTFFHLANSEFNTITCIMLIGSRLEFQANGLHCQFLGKGVKTVNCFSPLFPCSDASRHHHCLHHCFNKCMLSTTQCATALRSDSLRYMLSDKAHNRFGCK